MKSVAVIMDGARRYYDVPQALHRVGRLDRVFADWYAASGSVEAWLARLVGQFRPALGRRMGERVADLPDERVHSNPRLTLWMAANRWRFRTDEDFWAWSSAETAKWVRRVGWGGGGAVYGYVRNVHPRLFQEANRAGLVTVGEQMIAPAAVELAEAERQEAAWPGWAAPLDRRAYDHVRRVEEATWVAASQLVAPSEYVRQGLIGQGVSPRRVTLVPYPAEVGSFRFVDRRERTGPLTVGFVGQVNLRKNAPIVLEVARQFRPTEVRFVMVGKVFLRPEAVTALERTVELTGPRPRSEVAGLLAGFDVFLFPSTCEGSAGAVIEAMATGLPVLTTPNSGTPVRDGEEGFILDPDDAEGFAARVETLRRDPDRRHAMGRAARERVDSLTLDRYGGELAAVFDGVGR